MGAHPQPQLEAFRDFSIPDDLRRSEGIISELPELTDEHKRKILAGNYAEVAGIDIEERRERIAADEFAGREELADMFSQTDGELMPARPEEAE
jgi:hypothetical protein